MEPTESCVPPGFRFHPNDEELVGYYLKKKVASQKIDLDVIREVDLYRIEPWDIQGRCRMGYEEQNEWYFFSHKDKKYPTGTRTNRATMAGFWKATGRDKAVHDKAKLIGMRKTLVFYKGRAPNGQKTDWIIHEYRLESDENGPPQEEGWVVCRAFKKKTNLNMGSNSYSKASTDQGWDSSSTNNYSHLYEETSGLSSSSDHHHFHPRNPPNFLPPPIPIPSSSSSSHSFLCKQELLDHNHSMMMMNDLNSILFINSDPFLQLPQLQSPSVLPLPIKTPLSILSDQSSNNRDESGKTIDNPVCVDKAVTDWRSLDKFVASQLSHDNNQGNHHTDQGAVSSLGGGDDSDHGLLDMALLLMQKSGKDDDGARGGGEGDKFINGLLATNSESDLGIFCKFDKEKN